MGEVYRARDRRLERDVAIKVLPAHLSSSAQFRERFEREARAISQLNHPHICVLHDVGHENGTSYLVMELLEGESLADRLAKGPLPMEQVLRYGVTARRSPARCIERTGRASCTAISSRETS
jgi:eukaryotic-like serine/threonine-protein kinase